MARKFVIKSVHNRVGDVSVLLHRMRELNLDIAVRTEELNHLGSLQDVKDWGSDVKEWWWTKVGYCSILVWIKGTVKNKQFKDDVVLWWNKGVSCALERALDKKRAREYWETLKDSDDVVYFKRHPKPGDNYGTLDGTEANLYDLQQKVEEDPEYFISLVLKIKG